MSEEVKREVSQAKQFNEKTSTVDRWERLVTEQIAILNNEELFPNGGFEFLTEISKIKKSQGLNNSQMEALLDAYMVLEVKLPPERDKRKLIKLERADMLERFQNYLKGEIDRT
ncbi:TPA: hypothetical protein ACGBG5_003446 [Enterococcus faecalis]